MGFDTIDINLVKTIHSRQLINISNIFVLNSTSQHKEKILWKEMFVYPHGICYFLKMWSDEFMVDHFFRLSIVFTTLDSGFSLHITDHNQWTYLPDFKSFFGDKVQHKNKDYPEFQLFNIRLEERQMESADPKSRCSDYGSHTKYLRYSHCFHHYVEKEFKKILGCVPPILGRNKTTICRNIEPEDEQKLDFLLIKISEFNEVEECLKPCNTLTIVSTKLREVATNVNKININMDPMVTAYKTAKSSNMLTVLLEVGSSLGLWLGFGVLQIACFILDTLHSIYQKLRQSYKPFWCCPLIQSRQLPS